MLLERASVRVFRGPVSGVRSAGLSPRERALGLLEIVTPDGLSGHGEASPLPGYSGETLEGALAALSSIDWARLPECRAGDDATSVLADTTRALPSLPPSARFAVESALLDVLGQRRGVPVCALLREEGMLAGTRGALLRSPVPISAFAGGPLDEGVAEAIRAAAARGIGTVKLKIQGPSLGAQVDALRRLHDANRGVTFRLDANGSIPASRVVEELEDLADVPVELIEEPCPTAELADLEACPIPLALDESLREPALLERLGPKLGELGCAAVVLKPMALGGFSVCLGLARRARRLGLDILISHLFDGPVGLAGAAHLAVATATRSRASGLDRHGALDVVPAEAFVDAGAAVVLPPSVAGLGVRFRPGALAQDPIGGSRP